MVRRRSPRRVCWLLLVAAACSFGGCLSTDEEFPADTVRVEIGDRRYELEVISCGRDEELDVFALGASSSDSFVQLLLTIDGDEVDRAASAITFESRDTGVVAAGDGGLIGSPVGSVDRIERASIRGDRIDVETPVLPLDPAAAGAADRLQLDLVARCPAIEEVASGS